MNPILTEDDALGIVHAAFAWSPNAYGDGRGSPLQFGLRIEGKLEFVKGGINLIAGPTGKSTSPFRLKIMF